MMYIFRNLALSASTLVIESRALQASDKELVKILVDVQEQTHTQGNPP